MLSFILLKGVGRLSSSTDFGFIILSFSLTHILFWFHLIPSLSKEFLVFRYLDDPLQVVLLGSAPDPRIQGDFNNLANTLHSSHSDCARLCLTYDEPLSHLVTIFLSISLYHSLSFYLCLRLPGCELMFALHFALQDICRVRFHSCPFIV